MSDQAWSEAAAKLRGKAFTVNAYMPTDADRAHPEVSRRLFHAEVEAGSCTGTGWEAMSDPAGVVFKFSPTGPRKVLPLGSTVPHDICNVLDQMVKMVPDLHQTDEATGVRLYGAPDPDAAEALWDATPGADPQSGKGSAVLVKSFSEVALITDADGVPVRLELRMPAREDRLDGGRTAIVLTFEQGAVPAEAAGGPPVSDLPLAG